MGGCDNIVKELVAGGNRTEGGNQCGVNSTCKVEKCAHNILDVCDILWAKWFR